MRSVRLIPRDIWFKTLRSVFSRQPHRTSTPENRWRLGINRRYTPSMKPASSHADQTARFRRLHTQPPLVLPNAWDAGSARVIEHAGAQAIATTSAGIAWAHGCGDGQRLTRGEMIAAIERIVRAVSIPVTADIEGGYGTGSAAEVAQTVRDVIAVGAVGINLEDAPGVGGAVLLSSDVQVERIQAARAAAKEMGADLFINARTDVFLSAVGAPESRLEEVIRRALLYRAAGADGVFVPGVIDALTIAELVRQIAGPVNIMAMSGAPSIAELTQLGVARVSLGSALAQLALASVRRAALELLEQGTYNALEHSLPFGEIDGLFAREK